MDLFAIEGLSTWAENIGRKTSGGSSAVKGRVKLECRTSGVFELKCRSQGGVQGRFAEVAAPGK